jgi:hypothetical protein
VCVNIDETPSFYLLLFYACIFPLSFPGIEQGCGGRKRMSFVVGRRRLHSGKKEL